MTLSVCLRSSSCDPQEVGEWTAVSAYILDESVLVMPLEYELSSRAKFFTEWCQDWRYTFNQPQRFRIPTGSPDSGVGCQLLDAPSGMPQRGEHGRMVRGYSERVEGWLKLSNQEGGPRRGEDPGDGAAPALRLPGDAGTPHLARGQSHD